MAAPKGNQFWKLRSKHGRDKLFATSELLWDAACEYFQWCEDHPWLKMEQTRASKGSMGIGIKKGEIENIAHIPATELTGLPTSRPFTLSGLCIYLGCNQAYFRVFKGQLPKNEQDFNTVITRIEEIIYTQKFEGAAVGAFNANIIARDLGLSDNKTIKYPDGIPITGFNYVKPDDKAND